MRIISFIEDHNVIDKIIAHLKLTFHAERPPPPQIVQKELLIAAEERGGYLFAGFPGKSCLTSILSAGGSGGDHRDSLCRFCASGLYQITRLCVLRY